jgi:hypothetical protein
MQHRSFPVRILLHVLETSLLEALYLQTNGSRKVGVIQLGFCQYIRAHENFGRNEK